MTSLRELPTAQCYVSALNVRTEELEDGIAELAADIRANGLINPVSARANPDGRYEIYAGQRRFLAHQRLERPTILALVSDITDDGAEIRSLTENMSRADMTWNDKVRSFRRLQEKLGSIAAVRDKTGYSEATIRRYIAISNMDPAALAAAERAKVEARNLDMENLGLVARRFEPTDHAAVMEAVRTSGFNTQGVAEILRQAGGSLPGLNMAILERRANAINLTIARPFIRDPRNSRVYELPDMTPEIYDAVKAAIEHTISAMTAVAAVLEHPSICEICMTGAAHLSGPCVECHQRVCTACRPRCNNTCPFCRHSPF
jgi:ParB/RepB/Spo0J family partition protein